MNKIIFAVLFIVIAIPVFAVSSEEGKSEEIYTVERVIDGNTFELSNGETVQLIGVDAFEVKDNEKARMDSQRLGWDVEEIVEMGKRAAKFVSREIEGKKIRLEFDVQERDQYGRLLAYVDLYHCGPTCSVWNAPYGYRRYDDGVYIHLNAFILHKGYAASMTIPPNVAQDDLLKRMYQGARTNKRGLWAKLPSKSDMILNLNEVDEPSGKEDEGGLMDYVDKGMVNIKTAF